MTHRAAFTCGALISCITTSVTPARAQTDEFVMIDRIAAVVGATPIPSSRVEEELNLLIMEYQRTGRPVPTDSSELHALRLTVLNRLIDDELLVRRALSDTTVQVTDAQVQSTVETTLRQTRSQFSSESEYQRQLEAAGLGSPEEYRRYITEQTRRQLLMQGLIQVLRQSGDLRPVPPTEREIRQYYQETIAQQPRRPASVSFRQIVIRPNPTPEALERTRAQADSVLRELRAGADFETAARRFSDDPGTAQQGGELGWFRRGLMVPEFEAVAFRLRPGQISNLVRTPFGFHIIQVVRTEPAEIRARHVLFTPEVTDADIAAARARADSILTALRAGAAVDSLSRIYHDPADQGLFETVPATELPQSLQPTIEIAMPGEFLGPIELTQNGPTRYAVIQFLERLPEGEYTYEELRDRLRDGLTEGSGVRRYVEELREKTYVEIRL